MKISKELKAAQETLEQLKRFIIDGRIGLSDIHLDPKLDLYVINVWFRSGILGKPDQLIAANVPCSELRDIPEALCMIYKGHPAFGGEFPSFEMRINTLKKPHVATLRLSINMGWVRIKPKLFDAILADKEGYVKVLRFDREAFNTSYEYLDYYSIQICDPDNEEGEI